MMKKQIVGVLFAVSIVGGIGAGVLANAMTSDSPASASADKATDQPSSDKPSADKPSATVTSSGPDQAEDFVISPGAVGPVKPGMTKADAEATGLFDSDIPPAAEGCEVIPLAWKEPYAKTFDVLTVGNGEIVSIGVHSKGPTTKEGLGIGSTYAEVSKNVEDPTAIEAGYAQTGVYDYDSQTGGWIGYLFAPAVDDIKATDRVTLIEVTKGSQPGLMRDGC